MGEYTLKKKKKKIEQKGKRMFALLLTIKGGYSAPSTASASSAGTIASLPASVIV